MNTAPIAYVVIENGIHVRAATTLEAAEFRAANPDSTWEKATRVSTGAVVDTWHGPGIRAQAGDESR